MNWIKTLFSDSDKVSSKRFVALISIIILIEITQFFLISTKDFNTTQLIFIFGFWVFAGGYAGYLTIKKNVFNINDKKEKIDNVIDQINPIEEENETLGNP